MAQVVADIPWPSGVLSPNSRAHWGTVAKAKKRYRTAAAWAVHSAGPPIQVVMLRDFAKVNVKLSFSPPDKRARDHDNLIASCKALLDGVADALDIDDSQFVLTHEVLPPVKGGNVRVTITGGAK